MPPKAALIPLPDGVPFPLGVGEKVALGRRLYEDDGRPARDEDGAHLRVDHEAHPGYYGLIEAIGTDPTDNALKLDLRLYDPSVGLSDDDTTIYRATMEDIQ